MTFLSETIQSATLYALTTRGPGKTPLTDSGTGWNEVWAEVPPPGMNPNGTYGGELINASDY